MAMKDEVNAPLIVTLGILSGFLVLISAIGVQAGYLFEEQREITRKYDLAKNEWLEDIHRVATTHLTLSQLDQGRKAATVPIDVAMEIVAASGGKIAPVK